MTRRTLPEIILTLRSAMPLLVEDYALSEIGVFGSVVRGDAKPDSDIDILVDYTEPPTLFENNYVEQWGEPAQLKIIRHQCSCAVLNDRGGL